MEMDIEFGDINNGGLYLRQYEQEDEVCIKFGESNPSIITRTDSSQNCFIDLFGEFTHQCIYRSYKSNLVTPIEQLKVSLKVEGKSIPENGDFFYHRETEELFLKVSGNDSYLTINVKNAVVNISNPSEEIVQPTDSLKEHYIVSVEVEEVILRSNQDRGQSKVTIQGVEGLPEEKKTLGDLDPGTKVRIYEWGGKRVNILGRVGGREQFNIPGVNTRIIPFLLWENEGNIFEEGRTVIYPLKSKRIGEFEVLD